MIINLNDDTLPAGPARLLALIRDIRSMVGFGTGRKGGPTGALGDMAAGVIAGPTAYLDGPPPQMSGAVR